MAATHLITVRPVDQVVRLGNAPRRHFLDQVIFQTPGCFRLVRLFDDGLYSLSTRKRHRSHHDTRRFTSAEAHKFCLLNISHHVWPWALWVSGVTSSDVTHTHTTLPHVAVNRRNVHLYLFLSGSDWRLVCMSDVQADPGGHRLSGRDIQSMGDK